MKSGCQRTWIESETTVRMADSREQSGQAHTGGETGEASHEWLDARKGHHCHGTSAHASGGGEAVSQGEGSGTSRGEAGPARTGKERSVGTTSAFG